LNQNLTPTLTFTDDSPAIQKQYHISFA